MIPGRSREGFILVTVLWSFALMAVLAVAASTAFRVFGGVASAQRDHIRLEALLHAGLEMSGASLGAPLKIALQQTHAAISLATGTVAVEMIDEGGQVDVGLAAPALLLQLFLVSGAASDQARSAVDTLLRLRAQRTNAQNAAGTPGAPRLNDIRELRSALGLSVDVVERIRRASTVFGSEKVNYLTASQDVFRALPGLDSSRIQGIIDLQTSGETNPAGFAALLGPALQYTEARSTAAVRVRLSAQLPTGATATAEAVIVQLPGDSEPYRVLAWEPVVSSGAADRVQAHPNN